MTFNALLKKLYRRKNYNKIRLATTFYHAESFDNPFELEMFLNSEIKDQKLVDYEIKYCKEDKNLYIYVWSKEND